MKKIALLIALILTASNFVPAQEFSVLNKLTAEDMAILMEDQGYYALKNLTEDPEYRKKFVQSIKEFLATANQARKEGFADTPEAKSELADIALTTLAQSYDKKKNGDKTVSSPLSLITEKEIGEFYLDPKNEAGFQEYLKQKIASAKRNGQLINDIELSKEEIDGVKNYYARISIYANEAQAQRAGLGEAFWRKADLTIKMQQSFYLSRIYTQKVLEPKVGATSAEIANYLTAHPELSTKAQKAKAQSILRKARAGTNFATLAKRFSDDPGSKDAGGIYKDVKIGQMVPEFEQGALALRPGQIGRVLVESKYGYHILKLERKGKSKDADGEIQETYDVRHILVSTMIKDESYPNRPGVPLTDHVEKKIKAAKERKALDEILANNPVKVAEDFVIKLPPAPPEGAMPDEPPPPAPALKSEGKGDPVTKVEAAPVRKTQPKKRRPR